MKQLRTLSLLAAAACAAACSAAEPDFAAPGIAPPAAVEVAEDCRPIVSIEVVHRVNGVAVTDRLRLTDDAAEDPAATLRSFQVAADHFGTANVISTRPITQVACFPQTTAIRRAVLLAGDPPPGASLCVDTGGVPACDLPTPSHTYDYSQTESCSVTNHSEATELSCSDSNAIVTKRGDVVLTINTQALRADIAARTQALRRLVGDGNVVTNFHFDVVITPDQKAAIVGNTAYRNIAQQIKAASDNHQPLPDIQQILHNLPEPPTNIDFYAQLTKAYQTKLERLNALAKITNGSLLSPQQVNAFYQEYVQKSRLIDQLDVEHSQSSLTQAAGIIDDTINRLATTDPGSTVYKQVKAGGKSLLATHTNHGVFDPDEKLDFVVPDLQESLTDANIEKRIAASEMLIDFNEQLRKNGGEGRAAVMAGPIGLIATALSNDDMERVWRLWDQVKATEFFFDNNNPAGTSYDVHLTPEAEAMFNITVAPTSAKAYEVINVLNETAAYNAATGKITVDYRAVISINARSALTTTDLKRALYHTEESYGITNFFKTAGPAFLGGALKELGGTVSGIYFTSVKFWADPEAGIDHLKSAVANWRQAVDAVLDQGLDVIHRWPNMTLEEKSELLGRIGTQVLLSLPSEAKQAGRLNEAIREAARVHLDKAARGLAIVERGGLALSEEAAVEIAKRLERYGILGTEDSVALLDKLDDLLPCSFVGGAHLAPTVASAGGKPPCGIGDIPAAFEAFEARAQRLGLKGAADLEDLALASEKVSGAGRLVANAMDPKELGFARIILDKEGGVMVGNRAGNGARKAIDGFFDGGPMQLKTQPTESMLTVKQAMTKTRTKAAEEGLRGVRIFQRLENLTKEQVLAFVNDPTKNVLTIPKPGGTIRSIDILTSDGFWLHIEDGVVR